MTQHIKVLHEYLLLPLPIQDLSKLCETCAVRENLGATERFGVLIAPAQTGLDSPAHELGGSKASIAPVL